MSLEWVNENNVEVQKDEDNVSRYDYISRIENGNNGIKTQTLIKYMNILKITPNTLYKEFITDSQTKKNIELTEKICSLSEEKKVFITSVIDLLNDM